MLLSYISFIYVYFNTFVFQKRTKTREKSAFIRTIHDADKINEDYEKSGNKNGSDNEIDDLADSYSLSADNLLLKNYHKNSSKYIFEF